MGSVYPADNSQGEVGYLTAEQYYHDRAAKLQTAVQQHELTIQELIEEKFALTEGLSAASLTVMQQGSEIYQLNQSVYSFTNCLNRMTDQVHELEGRVQRRDLQIHILQSVGRSVDRAHAETEKRYLSKIAALKGRC